jgi:hypothetical protein
MKKKVGFPNLFQRLARWKKIDKPKPAGLSSPIPATAIDDYVPPASVRPKAYTEHVEEEETQRMKKLVDVQMKIEQERFKMEAALLKAEQKIKKVEAKQENDAYKKNMGYPAYDCVLMDIYANEYQVKDYYELLHPTLIPGVELRIKSLGATFGDPGMDVGHVVVYWVPSKLDMGVVYGDPDRWPDPNKPVLYCYVDSEDRVYVGTPEHGSVFSSSRPLGSKNSTLWRQVHSWAKEANNVYALLEYDKVVGGFINKQEPYVIPRELNADEKEKFDVFTNALKLRAEIIEEAKQVNANH